MKIRFYNVSASYIPGGLETYCWEAGRALARRGRRVSSVAGLGGEPRHQEAELLRSPFRCEQEWPEPLAVSRPSVDRLHMLAPQAVAPWFRQDAVERVLEEHPSGRASRSNRRWSLLVLAQSVESLKVPL